MNRRNCALLGWSVFSAQDKPLRPNTEHLVVFGPSVPRRNQTEAVPCYQLSIMAVPKKKTSKSKRNQRKAHWKRKAMLQAEKALSLGKSVLNAQAGEKETSFIYPVKDEDEDEE